MPMSMTTTSGPTTVEDALASAVRIVRARVEGITDAGLELRCAVHGRTIRRWVQAGPICCGTIRISLRSSDSPISRHRRQPGRIPRLDVPTDLSVAGFDDIARASTWDVP